VTAWAAKSAVNPLFLEESLQLMLSLQVVELDKNKYGDGPFAH
jgi:hypothetical protein